MQPSMTTVHFHAKKTRLHPFFFRYPILRVGILISRRSRISSNSRCSCSSSLINEAKPHFRLRDQHPVHGHKGISLASPPCGNVFIFFSFFFLPLSGCSCLLDHFAKAREEAKMRPRKSLRCSLSVHKHCQVFAKLPNSFPSHARG